MSKWKRLLALVLALVMTLSLTAMPSFADGESDNANVKKTYNIVINYVFEDNAIVSDSYTANLAEGTSFNTTVTFPTVQGYLPYVNDERTDSYKLKIDSVSEDVTINVVYKPTNVNYTVIHYQQNVDNDQYTEKERETKLGLTDSTVPEVAKTYEGFTALLYERPAIAADGSTVIEVYYDRDYFLLNLNLQGGWGAEPVYARYGSPIAVTNPERAGYRFQSWSPAIPATMPAADATHTAQWESDKTAKVTVMVWEENANDENYSYSTSYITTGNVGESFTVTDRMSLPCGQEEHTHSDACISCGKTEHTHTRENCYESICTHTHELGCYAVDESSRVYTYSLVETTKPTQELTDTGNGIYTYTTESDDYWQSATTHYYLNFDGKWYCGQRTGNITGSTSRNDEYKIVFSCSHSHTDDCYNLTCTTEAHEHTAACITCGKTEHTHSSACSNTMSMDSNLWKFAKSETVTVAADGSTVVNVYYDRVEYTINFYNKSGNAEYTNDRITAKWGADIHDKWPTESSSSTWGVTANFEDDTYQANIQTMPVGGDKFYGPKTSSSSESASYYVEPLAGESAGNNSSKPSGSTITYKHHHTDTTAGSGYNVTVEDRYDIEGFTLNTTYSTNISSTYSNAKFYYDRNTYYLIFVDGSEVNRAGVKFEAKLSTSGQKDYEPDYYPAYLEPGAYKFGGWYLDPAGTTPVDWDAAMPARNVTVYAKWVPIQHKVTFAQTEGATPESAQTVAHGAQAENYATENGNYTFVGWFYKDENDVEHAFNFSMAVTRDMDLYAKWKSNTMIPYTVIYQLEDGREIADRLTGSGLAGRTKTFEAKGGTELYADYQEGFFPTVQSQSITLDINETDGMTVIFTYVPATAVPYTVCYVTAETVDEGTTTYGTVTVDGKTYTKLAEDYKDENNRKAVVTETFKPISGYMPDAYQKRLVVTAGGENILYFYYTRDNEHALYKITHFTQNTDDVNWTEYASSTAQGDIGTRYTASDITIPGFAFKEIKYVVNGTEVTDVTAEGAALTADGLEINLYYVRNEYPYEVQHLDMAGNQLANPDTGKAKYGEVISYTGYVKTDIASAEYHHANPETITIQIEETPARNIIRIYYQTYCYVNHMWFGADGKVTDVESADKLAIGTGLSLNFTQKVTSGSLYGGTFTENTCTTPVTDPWNTTATRDTHYYIWEVPNDYLWPMTLTCWHHDTSDGGYELDVMGFYLVSGIDRDKYAEVGFFVDNVKTPAGQYTEADYEKQNGVVRLNDGETVAFESVTIAQKDGNNQTYSIKNVVPRYSKGYMLCYGMEEADWKDKNTSVNYSPYWITLDGVQVQSGVTRTATYQGFGYKEMDVKNTGDAKNPVVVQITNAAELTLMTMANYLADGTPVTSAPVVEDTVTVTVVDGESSYTVQTTDGTVALTPAGMEGKLFAGWYQDDVASDLTGLTGDCTLTAKYVSDSYLGLKYNRSGLLRVTGVTLVSAIDSEDYAETGFLVNGEKVVVDSYSTRYRLIYSAGSLFGSEVDSRAPLMSTTVSLSGSGSLTVAPYWVTRDGTTVTGPERSLSYTGWTIRG